MSELAGVTEQVEKRLPHLGEVRSHGPLLNDDHYRNLTFVWHMNDPGNHVYYTRAPVFAYTVAGEYDAGKKTRIDPAACLLHASRCAVEVSLEAIQSLGANGYINEYATGRIMRDAKLYEIGAGTSEIRRMLIGRELFNETA